MAIIPSLSLFYLGTVVASNNPFPVLTLLLVCLLTATVAVLGFVILQKYPKNIMKLRQYIAEISKGTLPDKIELEDAQASDDLQYIEDHFNHVLEKMKQRIAETEEQLVIEQTLRETIEKQQVVLVEAERQRAIVQTIGATCHHIGQPAAVLQLRMDLLENLSSGKHECDEIAGCIEAVTQLTDILQQLQRVSEFRTAPYIRTEKYLDDEILFIDPHKPPLST
jgi:methyl-accepting chemotaxis protein